LHLLQALWLGIVQGVTEFFPISSSTHLKITKYLLDIPQDGGLSFDLACHVGTWLALIYFLRQDLWRIVRQPKQLALLSLALIPLVPAYFLFKPLRLALSSPQASGYLLLVTAALLFLSCRKRVDGTKSKKWQDVIWIGTSQALALLPGISRSGATIATARWRGWTWIEGARFSFLLAVPTILGGVSVEALKGAPDAIDLPCCAVGLAASFLVGLGTIRLAFWLYNKNIVQPFAWYCLGLGLFVIKTWGHIG